MRAKEKQIILLCHRISAHAKECEQLRTEGKYMQDAWLKVWEERVQMQWDLIKLAVEL